MNTKAQIRSACLKARLLEEADRSNFIPILEEWLSTRQQISRIALFYPIKNEPNLLALAEKPGSYALPVTNKKDLGFAPWKLSDELSSNTFGIPEPISRIKWQDGEDLVVLVPAVAMDIHGYRVGYGGGFYDRLLKTWTRCQTIGVVWSKFILTDHIPNDPWDVPLGWVLSEKGINKRVAKPAGQVG